MLAMTIEGVRLLRFTRKDVLVVDKIAALVALILNDVSQLTQQVKPKISAQSFVF
jgi:hypothetical protein